MAPPTAIATEISPRLNPHVGPLAHRLLRTFQGRRDDDDRWALIEKVLNFAADAEQELAEQSARIAYLENLSTTDELTGLANRRGFDEALTRTLGEALRHGETGVVVMIDLDHFKTINDRHGHAAGDEALRQVAEVLKGNVRISDTAARLGGDEFGLLLTRTTPLAGARRARALQHILCDQELEIDRRTVALHASFGIEPYAGASCAEDLVRRADAAMYRDKHRRLGRPPEGGAAR